MDGRDVTRTQGNSVGGLLGGGENRSNVTSRVTSYVTVVGGNGG